MPNPKILITVSLATFNELAAQLERQGYKFGENVDTFAVEKGTAIIPDKDFRLAQMRQNAVDLASKTYQSGIDEDFVDYADKIFKYILDGKAVTTGEWK